MTGTYIFVGAFGNYKTIGRATNGDGNFVTSFSEDKNLLYDSTGNVRPTSEIANIKGVDVSQYDKGVFQYEYDAEFVKNCKDKGALNIVLGTNSGSNSLNIPGSRTWAGNNMNFSETEMIMPAIDVSAYSVNTVFSSINTKGYFEIIDPTVIMPDGTRTVINGTFRVNKLR